MPEWSDRSQAGNDDATRMHVQRSFEWLSALPNPALPYPGIAAAVKHGDHNNAIGFCKVMKHVNLEASNLNAPGLAPNSRKSQWSLCNSIFRLTNGCFKSIA